jgi:hypothetical protein
MRGCGEGGGTVHTGVFFVITDISDADAPSSVQVFSGATEFNAPRLARRAVARYSVDFPAGVTGITDATAVVPATWDGQFNVSHYLCGPAPSPSSSASSSSVEFEQ